MAGVTFLAAGADAVAPDAGVPGSFSDEHAIATPSVAVAANSSIPFLIMRA
jgi:hypothetical protein